MSTLGSAGGASSAGFVRDLERPLALDGRAIERAERLDRTERAVERPGTFRERARRFVIEDRRQEVLRRVDTDFDEIALTFFVL